MPTLRVAIDAREARSGAAEFAAAKDSIRRGGSELQTSITQLVEGFANVGLSIKNITPETAELIQWFARTGDAAKKAAPSVESLLRALKTNDGIRQFNQQLAQAEKAVLSLDAAIDRASFNKAPQVKGGTPFGAGAFEADSPHVTGVTSRFGSGLDSGRQTELEIDRQTKLQSIFEANYATREKEEKNLQAVREYAINEVRQKEEAAQSDFQQQILRREKEEKNLQAVREYAINEVRQKEFAAQDAIAQRRLQLEKQTARASIVAPQKVQDSTSVGAANLLARQKELVAVGKQQEEQNKLLTQSFGPLQSQLVQLTLGFSAIFAIRKGISETIDELREFDRSLAELQAITHSTAEETQRLSDVARTVGVNSIFGANQAVGALTELAKAGLNTEESLQALPNVLNFATVANIDLAKSTDIISRAIRQFNLDFSQSETVVDALTIAANKTTTSVGPLAEALVNIGPIASDLGNSVQETTAALGVLGDRGIVASTAGTKLRGVLLQLVDPSLKAREAIESLHRASDQTRLAFEDVDPAAHSIVDIMKTFHDANLSAEEATAIFNRRFAATGLVLSEGVGKVEAIIKADKELEGETARIATRLQDTVDGAFKKFKAAIEELTLKVGDDGLSGGIKSTTLFLRDLVIALAGSEDRVHGVSDAAIILADALKAVAVGAAVLYTGKLLVFLSQSSTGFFGLTSAIESARIAMLYFQKGATFTDVLTGISGLLPVIAAATAGIYLLSTAYGDVTDKVPEFTEEQRKLAEVEERLADAQKSYAAGIAEVDYQKQLAGLKAVKTQVQEIKEQIETGAKQPATFHAEQPLKGLYEANPKALELADTLGSIAQQLKISGVYSDALGSSLDDVASSDTNLKSVNVLLAALDDKIKAVAASAHKVPSLDFNEGLDKAQTSLEKYIDTLNLEIDIANQTAGLDKSAAKDKAAVITATYELAHKARGKEKDDLAALIAEYAPAIAKLREIKDAQEALTAAEEKRKEALIVCQRENEQLNEKAGLLRFSIQQRKIETEVQRFANLAYAAGVDFTDADAASIRQRAQAIQDDTEQRKDNVAALAQMEKWIKNVEAAYKKNANAQKAAEASAQTLVDRWKALADTANDSSEAQKKATVLAQFDAVTRGHQTDAVENLRKELEKYIDTYDSGQNRAAVRDVEKLVAGYEAQAAAISLTEDETRSAQAQLQLTNVALGHNIDGMEEFQARLDKALKTLNEGASKGRQKQAEDIVRNLDKELKYIFATNAERAKGAALDQLDLLALQGKIENYEELKHKISDTVDQLERAAQIKDLADGIGAAFGNEFTDALDGAKSLHEEVNSLLRDIVKAAEQALLIKPLVQGLSSGLGGFFGNLFNIGGSTGGATGQGSDGGSAHGNIFSHGQIQPFAKGGLITQPTYFPMYDNRTGLAGERGTEAIMPLKRDSAGNLGVSGGGSKTINFYITTKDANSFKKSQRQIAQDVKRSL